jgi:hypothetical protein
MRGIYYCIGQNLDEKSSGIAKKIVNQIKSMENCNIKMYAITWEELNQQKRKN